MKCYKCGSKTESAIKLINYRGKSVLINIEKCVKCNHTYTPLKEAEKARIDLNPSFIERLKNFFDTSHVTEAILKGKVL